MWLARCHDDAVVVFAQLCDVVDGGIETEIDMAVVLDKAPVAFDDVVWEAFLWNHIECAANLIACFEDDDANAGASESSRGGDSGRAGTDDGDATVERLCHRMSLGLLVVFLQYRRLDFWNIDRKIDGIARARVHAEFIGANETACLPEWIVARYRHDGVGPVAIFGKLDEFMGIAVDGARRHARLSLAVETAIDFGAQLQRFEIKCRCFVVFATHHNNPFMRFCGLVDGIVANSPRRR